MTTLEKEARRNSQSVYLARKAEALIDTLDYFMQEKDRKLKQIIFLSQIDFWDWEISELIYSFENFDERSKVWNNFFEVEKNLGSIGIHVHHNLLGKVKRLFDSYNSYRNNSSSARLLRRRYDAPDEVLNTVIEKWNTLIRDCRKRMYQDKKGLEQCGVEIKDLNEYLKEV